MTSGKVSPHHFENYLWSVQAEGCKTEVWVVPGKTWRISCSFVVYAKQYWNMGIVGVAVGLALSGDRSSCPKRRNFVGFDPLTRREHKPHKGFALVYAPKIQITNQMTKLPCEVLPTMTLHQTSCKFVQLFAKRTTKKLIKYFRREVQATLERTWNSQSGQPQITLG